MSEDGFRAQYGALRAWLVDHAMTLQSLDEAFTHVGQVLGESLDSPRVSLAILPTHDIVDGVHYIWRAEAPGEVSHIRRPPGFLNDPEHLKSPLETVMRSRRPLRVSCDEYAVISQYPFLVEQFAQGLTDYVAVPLRTRRELVHILTVMTSRPGGWDVDVGAGLASIAPAMAVVTEIFEVENLLEEKETLLREVHHRVKNNLQIVGSLLAMQRARLENEAAQQALRVGEDRVRAIAAVHRHIYGMRDLAAVELRDYVASLVRQLVQASTPMRRLRLALAPVVVRVEDAVPIGLIINELVTNAMQHGTRGAEVDLEVELVATPEHLTFLVRNAGPAITQGASTSLGLQLVRTLSRQLRGTLTLRREAGIVEAEVQVRPVR